MPDNAHLGPTSRAARGPDAVVLSGIAQRLGGRWALRGLSLRVSPGELVAIVGHNGSGKTTMLRVIATALRPTRGSGSVYGCDLKQDPDGARAFASMLTHSTGLYDDLSAAENLEFAIRMLGMKPNPKDIDAALDRVDLLRFRDHRVRSFSSGMQRRVAVARLFLRKTPLLLLDEPYNSLDPAGVVLIDELLTETKAAGGSALVVLHDLERGAAQFDRIVELSQGKVLTERSTKPATVHLEDDALQLSELAAGGLA